MSVDANGKLQISQVTAEDWPVVREWAADEGWNPGHEDGSCFLPQDPDGFFLGRIDGVPVSAVSVVNYGDAYSFLGLYLVRPEFRGRGHGLATWQHAMPHAGTRTIGLDGVVARQDDYRRSGFAASHRHVRHVGSVGSVDSIGSVGSIDVVAEPGRPAKIRPVADIALEEITAYDGQCFPAERPAFLKRWLTAPGHHALGIATGGRLTGYGVIRPARHAHRIGPLFADSPADAGALITALAGAVGEFAIDVPDDNPAALALMAVLGMKPVFEVARMYTGPIRLTRRERVYGVTSLELG